MTKFETFLTQEELYRQVCVRAPYFAWRNLEAKSSADDFVVVSGDVTREVDLGDEVGPIKAAEAGRHLAILGACAAAANQPSGASSERHFYLAQSAKLVCYGPTWPSRVFHGTASAKLSKRAATAHCTLYPTPTGSAAYELDVEYAVLREAAFERVYSARWVAEVQPPDPRAHTKFPRIVGQQLLQLARGECAVGYFPVTDAMCAGHFPHFPCLPVAQLLGAVSELAQSHVQSLMPERSQLAVVRGDVEAKRLAWVGETVHLTTWVTSVEGNRYELECRAHTDPHEKYLVASAKVLVRAFET